MEINMKIKFEDNSYVEIKKDISGDDILIIIQAKDQMNDRKKITNAVKLSIEEFKKLISDI